MTPSAWLTRFNRSEQVLGRLFGVAREAAQIAEQHGDLRLARGQDHFGVAACRASSTTGEKNWLSPARWRSSSRTSRSELSRRGDQLGEFQIVAQIVGIGRLGWRAPVAGESASDVDAPALAGLAAHGRAIMPNRRPGSG